ncbi:MAG: hypothetical protein ABW101_07370 [Candidatus Thiodiazotropha sp.]
MKFINSITRLVLASLLMMLMDQAHSGAACVVAKRQGDSLAIEWAASSQLSAAQAIDEATERLVAQGYRLKGQDVHAQANTDLPHAYLVIVKTHYTTLTGRERTSYGCGYSPRSATEAEQAALYDLRNYSWGWKPEFGYEVMEKSRY